MRMKQEGPTSKENDKRGKYVDSNRKALNRLGYEFCQLELGDSIKP